jgi:hypothetical protein
MSLEHILQVKIVDRLLLSNIKRTDLTPEAYMPYPNPHFPAMLDGNLQNILRRVVIV